MIEAVQGTFQTTELLEMIVGNLSFQDIGNVRGVSTEWRDTIDGSIQLKKQRFLEPDPYGGGFPVYVWISGHMMSATGHFAPPTEDQTFFPDDPDAQVPIPVVTGHPVLTRNAEGLYPEAQVDFRFPYTLTEMLSWPEGGQWQRTLFTQPPCTELHVCIIATAPNLRKDVTVKDPEGVRLGLVVQKLRELAYPCRLRRAAKSSRPIADLEKYTHVHGFIDGVVLSNGILVRQAESYEEIGRMLQQMEADEAATDAALASATTIGQQEDGDGNVCMAEDPAPEIDGIRYISSTSSLKINTTTDTEGTDGEALREGKRKRRRRG